MDSQLYQLTKMTGREASASRTVVVGVVDVSWRVVVIGLAGLLTGIPLVALLWPLVGSFALVMLIGWITAGLWLFHGRSRRGLAVHNYVRLLNRRRAVLNRFLLGPALVTVPRGDWRIVRRGSQDNPDLRVWPEDQAAATRAGLPARVAAALFDD